jgi:hypothetical protein
MMKKNYEDIQVQLVLFDGQDVVRTSQNDNVVEMPDFPEAFTGNGN